jgi:hypothetical protein
MARFNHDNLRKKISETSDTYRSRIRGELPQFPLDVIDHWLVQHGNALDHTDWLDLRSLTFTSEMWSTGRVLSDLRHWNDAGVEEEHYKFTEQSGYRGRYPLAFTLANMEPGLSESSFTTMFRSCRFSSTVAVPSMSLLKARIDWASCVDSSIFNPRLLRRNIRSGSHAARKCVLQGTSSRRPLHPECVTVSRAVRGR